MGTPGTCLRTGRFGEAGLPSHWALRRGGPAFALGRYAPAQFELAEKLDYKAHELAEEVCQVELNLSPKQQADLKAGLGVEFSPTQEAEFARVQSRVDALEATNRAEAMLWVRRAAENGLAEAQYRLGLKLRFAANQKNGNSGFGCPVTGAEYWEWWYKAAERGHGQAAYDLAFDLERTQQYAEAAKWYKAAMSAEPSGSPLSAASHLAELYYDGKGVAQDRATAIKLALRVADGADPGSDDNLYLRLGKWYAVEGPSQDVVEAYKWFNVVAAMGHFFPKEAEQRRNALAARMTPQQIADAERRSTQFLDRWQHHSRGEKAVVGESVADADITGSGFFITEDGYFCTSFHVVEHASKILLRRKAETLPAKVVSRDVVNDLAILKVQGHFPAIRVASSRSAQLGDTVFTIGFPNVAIQGVDPKLTRGEISSLAGIQDDPRFFQISVPVQPGNSGGPLVDSRGNVVGIIAMRMDDNEAFKMTGALPQNVNYAVKSSLLLSLAESVYGLSGGLKQTQIQDRPAGRNAIDEVQRAMALVLVYE